MYSNNVPNKKNAWLAFKSIAKDFLGNTWAQNYVEIFEQLLESFKLLDCSISIKFHFSHSHFAYFLEILGAVSGEQEERFNQYLKIMKARYQDRWDVQMMTDYIVGESSDNVHSIDIHKHKQYIW